MEDVVSEVCTLNATDELFCLLFSKQVAWIWPIPLYYCSKGIRPQISHNWIQILLGSNLIDFTVQVLRVALYIYIY